MKLVDLPASAGLYDSADDGVASTPPGEPWLVRVTVNLDATGHAAVSAVNTDDRWRGFWMPQFVIQSGSVPSVEPTGPVFSGPVATITLTEAGMLAVNTLPVKDLDVLAHKLAGNLNRVLVVPDPDTRADQLLPLLDTLNRNYIQWYFPQADPPAVPGPKKVSYALKEQCRTLVDQAVADDAARYPAARPLAQVVLRLRCDVATPYREIRKFLLMNLGTNYDCRAISMTAVRDGHDLDIGRLHLEFDVDHREVYWFTRYKVYGNPPNSVTDPDTPPILAHRVQQNDTDIALTWLAAHQADDGHWDTVKNGAQDRCDTSATALAVLAFLDAGHTDRRGQWHENVARALHWLKNRQDATGCFHAGVNGVEIPFLPMRGGPKSADALGGNGPDFTHALCTLAFTESYGLSKSPWLKPVAIRGLTYAFETNRIADAAMSVNLPGWSLRPRTGTDSSVADAAGNLYVSVWYIVLATSARLAGLPTSHATPSELQSCLARFEATTSTPAPADPDAPASAGPSAKTADNSGHRYGFTPKATPNPVATRLGNLARLYCDFPLDTCRPGAAWSLAELGPPPYLENGTDFDLFGTFAATMLYFQIGGDPWNRWNDALRDPLIDHQLRLGEQAGSWTPNGTMSRLGRVPATALGALNLEVYYRYSPLCDYGWHKSKK